jgi:hypothetical protein
MFQFTFAFRASPRALLITFEQMNGTYVAASEVMDEGNFLYMCRFAGNANFTYVHVMATASWASGEYIGKRFFEIVVFDKVLQISHQDIIVFHGFDVGVVHIASGGTRSPYR